MAEVYPISTGGDATKLGASENPATFLQRQQQREDMQLTRQRREKAAAQKQMILSPEYWVADNEYFDKALNDYYDKWSGIFAETNGDLSPQQRREWSQDRQRIMGDAKMSMQQKGLYDNAFKRMQTNPNMYNIPESERRLMAQKTPTQDAMANGRMEELKRLGVPRYREQYMSQGTYLKANNRPMQVLTKTYDTEIKDLTQILDKSYVGPKGGSTTRTVERTAEDLLTKVIMPAYDMDEVFQNSVNNTYYDSPALQAKYNSIDEYLGGMAEALAKERRVTKRTGTVKAPKKGEFVSSGDVNQDLENLGASGAAIAWGPKNIQFASFRPMETPGGREGRDKEVIAVTLDPSVRTFGYKSDGKEVTGAEFKGDRINGKILGFGVVPVKKGTNILVEEGSFEPGEVEYKSMALIDDNGTVVPVETDRLPITKAQWEEMMLFNIKRSMDQQAVEMNQAGTNTSVLDKYF